MSAPSPLLARAYCPLARVRELPACGPRAGRRSMLACPPPAPPAPYDDCDYGGDHEQDGQPGDDVGRGTDQVLHVLPIRPGRIAGPGQAADPGHAADRGVHAEAHWPHAGVAGRQRDERPDHGQQAPEEDGPPAVAIEPVPRPLDARPAAKEPRPPPGRRLTAVPA